ncbi:MAG TPA: apolipoprotein N-acyltransferase [Streptosporangiaceae bacterium]
MQDIAAEDAPPPGVATGPATARATPRRRRPPWKRALLAAAGGLAQCAALPPVNWWPLAPIGVACVVLAIRGTRWRGGAFVGLFAGLGLMIPMLQWLRPVGYDAWAALGFIESLYFVPLGVALAYATRLRGWPVWAAALWVAQEAVRGRLPYGGFPWGKLAFGQTDDLLARLAALGGAPLVTFATALSGGLLAYAVVLIRRARKRPGAAVNRRRLTGAVAALAGVVAVQVCGLAVPIAQGSGHDHNVAVVQGNVPRSGLDFLGQREAVLRNHTGVTQWYAQRVREKKAPRPQLVIWPENSSDVDPMLDPGAYDQIQAAVTDIGAPVLVGALISPRRADGSVNTSVVENQGVVWDPVTGPGKSYAKRHLVVFGEYIPYRTFFLKFIGRLDRVGQDKVPGHRSGALRMGPVTIGDVICFEVAYDEIPRQAVNEGGQILVVQTNDATYGRTGMPEQQLAISRLRAVEHDRPVLVAATSGISAIIARDGRIIDRSREFTPDVLTASVPAIGDRTIADRIGAAPEWALTALGVAAAIGGAFAGRRKRQEAQA